MDKALGYEPGDSRFEFWAVHQNIMINNLQVYVINLKQDTERLKNISYELNKQNINDFEIIEAIDAKRINKKELHFSISKNKKFINPLNTNMNDQEICCSLSHLKAYERFINSKFDYALILEDDAFFIDKFTENLKKFLIKNFIHEKQIIFLSELWEFFKKPIDKNNNYEIVNVTNAVMGHAYLINKKAAISISSFNYPVKTLADNFIIFKLYCGVNLLGLNPFILKQDHKKFNSSIPVGNKMNKVFLFKRSYYRLVNKIFRLFGMFNSHK